MNKVDKEKDYELWALVEATDITTNIFDSFYETAENLYKDIKPGDIYKIASNLTVAHAIHYTRLLAEKPKEKVSEISSSETSHKSNDSFISVSSLMPE